MVAARMRMRAQSRRGKPLSKGKISMHIILNKKQIIVEKMPKNQKEVQSKKKVRAKDKSRFNAVKTGAHAAGLLPWESEEAFKAHCEHFMNYYRPIGYIERGIVKDMAVNRWQRKRLDLMTTAATHWHEFGQAVVESGAASWQEVEKFVREFNMPKTKTLESIAASMARLAELSVQLSERAFDADEASQAVERIEGKYTQCCELLSGIDAKLDLERDFFECYIPQKFEQRIKLENLLDGQFDKMCARLQILQEARLRRDQLLLSQQQAAAVLLVGKSADRKTVENDSTESDELNRDDTGQPCASGGDRSCGRPREVDDVKDPDDPLNKFANEL
jgi:hypothetical protein